MKGSSLSSQQFCQLKRATIEKRTLAYYKKSGDESLLLRETALLHILESLKNKEETFFPQKKQIQQFYLKIYHSGIVLSPWFVYLWRYFRNYFTRKIIFFLEKLFKVLEFLGNLFLGKVRLYFFKRANKKASNHQEKEILVI